MWITGGFPNTYWDYLLYHQVLLWAAWQDHAHWTWPNSHSHIGDRCIRVTIHHCFFDGTRQRQPCVRFGKVHLYNNYTRNWGIYAVCASVESQVSVLLSSLDLFLKFSLHANWCARFRRLIDFLKIILQIYSQCNVYEAETKKKTFEF